MDVFHDVTQKKKTAMPLQYTQKLCCLDYVFQKRSLKCLSLTSIALKESGKLLKLVKITWLRLSSGVNNSFRSHLGTQVSYLQKDLICYGKFLKIISCRFLYPFKKEVLVDLHARRNSVL